MRLEAAVEIAAPPDVVFAQVADIERWPQTVRAIEDIELITAGPVRVGTRFRETRTMFGRKAAEEMTVAEFDPPRRFVLTAENHGTRYVATHAVEPVADGSRLVLAFEGVPVTLAASSGLCSRARCAVSSMPISPTSRRRSNGVHRSR